MRTEQRLNYSRRNQFAWNDMLAALDLKLIGAGVAFRISDWPGLNDFSGDIFFRLHLPLFGRFRVSWPGGSIEEKPGNLYLLPAGTPLKFSDITPTTHIWAHFFSRHLQTLLLLSSPRVIPAEESQLAAMDHIYGNIENADSFCSANHLHCLLSELLMPFLEQMADNLPRNIPVSEFSRVINYIDAQLNRDIEVAELSSIVNLPRAEFSAAFRQAFGIPPKQFISLRRITRARELLLESSFSIKEIALRCGYQDEFFFHRIFKKYTGIPPARYRKYSVY